MERLVYVCSIQGLMKRDSNMQRMLNIHPIQSHHSQKRKDSREKGNVAQLRFTAPTVCSEGIVGNLLLTISLVNSSEGGLRKSGLTHGHGSIEPIYIGLL